MEWADFNTRHEDCDKAFEALGRHLFSKWCDQKYSNSVVSIVYTGGKGGDGGVEAFARFKDGSVLGLQAKWFREKFDDNQVQQIHKSIKSARQRHPTLKKYFVCMPIELQASKGGGNKGKSQVERWEEFVASYTDIEFTFWDDNKIEEIALEVGMPDILAYWFGRNFISQTGWCDLFERKLPWFEARYIPDLHMQGEFDDLLKMYLMTAEVRNKYIGQIKYHQQKINRCIVELERLPSLYNWEKMPTDDQNSLKETLACAQKGVLLLDELREGLSTDSELNIMAVSMWLENFQTDARNAIDVIENARTDGSGLTPMYHCQQHLKEVVDLEDAEISWEFQGLISVDSPLALVGDAGSGKTHSALDVAKMRMDRGFPALVIPAKAINPAKASSDWLPNFLDKPGWSLQECFQSMEVASFYSSESIGEGGDEIPSRFLLVIDGLEESPRNILWNKTLAEWEVFLRSYPHIQLVCTTRPTTEDDLVPHTTFAREFVTQEQNVPLHKLFAAYCRAYHINCSGVSWVKWALRSPREIRLFAEVYQGKRLKDEGDLAMSVGGLIKKIILQIENRIKEDERYDWIPEKSILVPGLRSYAKAVLKKGSDAIEHKDILDSLKSGCAELNGMALPQLNHVVNGLVTGGLLDKRILPAKNALDEEQIYYYPANQSVLDFLLAYLAIKLLEKNDQDKVVIPELFAGRFESLAIYIQMLNETEGIYIDQTCHSERISAEWIDNAQFIAMSRSIQTVPQEMNQWVESMMLRNKETNRRVLNYLILSTARNPRHWCGAGYLHKSFLGMTVAERDLLWSCPDYLRNNCGGKWEGYAEFRLDQINLYPNDRAVGMPLLLAWTCSSVVAKRVRTARTKLALWGAANPAEMTALLAELTACNDPQVLESILTAAAGAACYAEDMNGLKGLASQCYQMFFSEIPQCSTRNSVCRHAARVVVERAYAFDLVSAECLADARPPYKACPQLLPYLEIPQDCWKNPIHGDLEWYVVKDASRGFFEQMRETEGGDEPEEVSYPQSSVVKAMVEGRISIKESLRPKVAELWDEMEAARRVQEARWKTMTDDFHLPFENVLADEGEISADESAGDGQEVCIEDLVGRFHGQEHYAYSPQATALLAKYEQKYDVEHLMPDALRNGLILSFVYSLGWNPELFCGKPNGGKDGEILGADIAITREHYPATHGSRSPVASFGEKYVWLGVNEVAGDFADRMPTRDYCDDSFEPVTCYSDVGEEMPDPFDGVGTIEDNSKLLPQMSFPEHFWFDYDAVGSNQLEKSTDWVNNANWPDMAKVISDGDQLRICSWIHGVESTCAVSQMARTTCLLVPQDQFQIFERDAKAGCVVFDDHGGNVSCAGIEGACYQSPSIICWAPWTKTIDDTYKSYDSLDEDGNIFPIRLSYLSAKTWWSHGGGETMLYFPSPNYAPALGIVRGDGSKNYRQFKDKHGFPVAKFERLDFGVSATVEQLRIDSGRLDALLEEEEAVAVWYAHVYREVRPEFIPESERRDIWARRSMSFICAKGAGKEVRLLSSVEIDEG